MTHYTFPGDINQFTSQFIENGQGIFIADDESIGFGTDNPTCPFDFSKEIDLDVYSFMPAVTLNIASSGETTEAYNFFGGLASTVTNNATYSGEGTVDIYGIVSSIQNNEGCQDIFGFVSFVTHNAGDDCNAAIGVYGGLVNQNGSAMSEGYGLNYYVLSQGAESEIDTAYGIKIRCLESNGGIINTAYGLYIGSVMGTSKWPIYVDDSGPNYFAGDLGLGVTEPTAKLDIDADIMRLRTSKTPASASASGNAGEICWDANYLYVCVATDTWRRTPLSSW